VSAQAESEVSADLSALQQRTVRTARLIEVVKSRQLELEAVKRRQQVGAASAHDVILGTQTLLVDDDELAASAGELAYAWIRLQASTGGQALQARGQPDE
jgi:outer membrane protein TolC